MRRGVHVLMLVLLLGQVGGFHALAGGDPCLDPCEDDEGQDCPPACPSCSCSLRSTSIPASPAVAVFGPPQAGLLGFDEPDRLPPDPGSREILRVPKARLVSIIG